MSDVEDTREDDRRTLRSAKGPVSHVSLGPEGDRKLFHRQRERRARAAEASRAFARKASAIAAMATTTMSTSAQQTSQAGSSGTAGSTVVQTVSQSTGLMASQPAVLSPEDVAIQQASLQEAQLQQALGKIKREKEIMIRRRARMQQRGTDIEELETMDLTHMDEDVKVVRRALVGVIEMQEHQTTLLQDIQQSLAVLAGRAQAAPSPAGPGAWSVPYPPLSVPPVTRVSPYVAPSSIAIVSLGMPLSGGVTAGSSLQVPVQTVFTPSPSQVAVTTQPAVSQLVQPQGTQPQQLAQQPVSPGPQPGCKLTLPHEEVLVAASYLEGSAARWLSGLVQLQGYDHDFRSCAASQKLEDFLKMVEDRWHDPQEAQKVTDAILTLHTRQFKSVRDATDAVERLICVPGVRYDPQVLLTSYLRTLSLPLRNQLAKEANINMHNFPSFSKVALDLEAKIGHGQAPTTEGRKKTLPPNWKAKGRIMFVDNDGSTIELDGNFQEGVGAEAGSDTSEGGVVGTVTQQKGKGTGRRPRGSRSKSQTDPNALPWEKAGLVEDVSRDRWARQACIKCGQYGHNMYKCRNRKVPEKIPPTMGSAVGSSQTVGSNVSFQYKRGSIIVTASIIPPNGQAAFASGMVEQIKAMVIQGLSFSDFPSFRVLQLTSPNITSQDCTLLDIIGCPEETIRRECACISTQTFKFLLRFDADYQRFMANIEMQERFQSEMVQQLQVENTQVTFNFTAGSIYVRVEVSPPAGEKFFDFPDLQKMKALVTQRLLVFSDFATYSVIEVGTPTASSSGTGPGTIQWSDPKAPIMRVDRYGRLVAYSDQFSGFALAWETHSGEEYLCRHTVRASAFAEDIALLPGRTKDEVATDQYLSRKFGFNWRSCTANRTMAAAPGQYQFIAQDLIEGFHTFSVVLSTSLNFERDAVKCFFKMGTESNPENAKNIRKQKGEHP
ncbi:hypothetical protein CBR_g18857 [Chara braunii]|uniref:CCHC-type domain-containing protein n=1 Tax=Chara braunii TaxID=69332 RepID=A0A388KWK5_CHABU|nr:hypothetical protein CBR_g18857 [Chara braunii]|eukprot:GBG74445.1 hypothetical protein CBR_g18857 [Chara braunii]